MRFTRVNEAPIEKRPSALRPPARVWPMRPAPPLIAKLSRPHLILAPSTFVDDEIRAHADDQHDAHDRRGQTEFDVGRVVVEMDGPLAARYGHLLDQTVARHLQRFALTGRGVERRRAPTGR